VYVVKVLMTTSDGKTKDAGTSPHLYKRNILNSYQLKLKSSRALFNEIKSKFSVFPFSLRAVGDKKLLAGLSECAKHGLIEPLGTIEVASQAFVAQFQATVLVEYGGPVVLSGETARPPVHSAFSVEQDPELAALLQQPVQFAKQLSLPAPKKPRNPASRAMEM